MEYFKSLINVLVDELGTSTLPVILWVLIKFITKFKLFGDVGEKKWKAFIPFYNTAVQFKLVWKVKWFLICIGASIPIFVINEFGLLETGIWGVIASLLTFFCFTIDFLGQYHLGRAFDKGKGFSLCLGFFNPIFAVLLAFTDHRYMGPYLTKEKNRIAFENAVYERAKELGIDVDSKIEEKKVQKKTVTKKPDGTTIKAPPKPTSKTGAKAPSKTGAKSTTKKTTTKDSAESVKKPAPKKTANEPVDVKPIEDIPEDTDTDFSEE